jgi:hypothetical protein
MRRLLIPFALILATQLLSAQAPVTVFVTSAGAVNGFTDPSKENQDSVKDLRFHLKGRKAIALTDTRDDATIVLVVQNREIAGLKKDILGGVNSEAIVRVRFITKGYESELKGSSSLWATAAREVAKQVEDWVKANRDKL